MLHGWNNAERDQHRNMQTCDYANLITTCRMYKYVREYADHQLLT
jgi:hypothetical protein